MTTGRINPKPAVIQDTEFAITLYSDKLVVRSADGRLIRRCTSEETAFLLKTVRELVEEGVCGAERFCASGCGLRITLFEPLETSMLRIVLPLSDGKLWQEVVRLKEIQPLLQQHEQQFLPTTGATVGDRQSNGWLLAALRRWWQK